MIHVHFDPQTLTGDDRLWWDTWEARAKVATVQAIAAWESKVKCKVSGKFLCAFEEDVWKDLRDFLLKVVFKDKCAYCETPAVRVKFHTDHFRPKGRVRFRPPGQKRMILGSATNEWDEDEHERTNEVEHPGYFWLAYHWKNLLPSCHFCNAMKGKKEQFPVEGRHIGVKRLEKEHLPNLRQAIIRSEAWDDVFYLQPDDLDVLEGRLLLNPYDDDPQQHLEFDESGHVWARQGSEKGKYSIQVYDLNGEDLVHTRRQAMANALMDYGTAILSKKAESIVEKRRAGEEMLAPYRRGELPYSAAVLDYLHLNFRGSPYDPAL